MAKINDVEARVYVALKNHPKTRADNFYLYLSVLKHYVDITMPMEVIFRDHKKLGIPALETITRCRRKLQEKYPELRDEAACNIRANEEQEYRDYSKE